jgi:cystathionine beta-lyase/cystathionine gamma-synthase
MRRVANDPDDYFSCSLGTTGMRAVSDDLRKFAHAPALGKMHSIAVHACIISDHSMQSHAIN